MSVGPRAWDVVPAGWSIGCVDRSAGTEFVTIYALVGLWWDPANGAVWSALASVNGVLVEMTSEDYALPRDPRTGSDHPGRTCWLIFDPSPLPTPDVQEEGV